MSVLMVILNVLSYIFLNVGINDQWYYLIPAVLTLFGLWGVFRKCGLTPWHVLIPYVRNVRLGEAAGMEKEGRIMGFLSVLTSLVNIAGLFVSNSGSTVSSILDIAGIFLFLLLLVYQIRVYMGLTEVFNRKKPWIILWVLFEWIPAIIWGWFKEYQPLWKASELKNSAANFFSGSKAEVMDQGLTVKGRLHAGKRRAAAAVGVDRRRGSLREGKKGKGVLHRGVRRVVEAVQRKARFHGLRRFHLVYA